MPQGGHGVTSSLQIRAAGADYARIKAPDMHAPCVQPARGLLKVELRAAASSACTAMQESRCSAASARALPLPIPTARSPLMVCRVPKCCRRCHWPMRKSSCSHHLPATLLNAGILRGGEHGSFVRGHTASSSMKGCSLGMTLRCVLPGRHSAREVCSTLPARRNDRSKFTTCRSVGRRYLLCFNALRV